MDILSFIRFILLLSVLIFVHEGGHFLFAKLFGVAVEEFGFGIPPRVIGKKIKDTIYSLNLLPIGGFVRLKGEAGETLGFGGADSFAIQSKIKRVLIIAAGAFGNFALAWLVFSVLLVVGTPVSSGKVLVVEVSGGSPAQEAGILPGDLILSLGGQKAETAKALTDLTNQNLGEPTVVEIESLGELKSVTLVPRLDPPSGEGSLGVLVQTATEDRVVPWWRAPLEGFTETARTLGAMVQGFAKAVGDLVRGEDVQVGGPVAIFALSEMFADGGFKSFASFMAILSLNLVVVNLIPIPALDGGRILFITLEAIRGKKLSTRTEHLANSLGFAFLILVIILISIRDVRTFF